MGASMRAAADPGVRRYSSHNIDNSNSNTTKNVINRYQYGSNNVHSIRKSISTRYSNNIGCSEFEKKKKKTCLIVSSTKTMLTQRRAATMMRTAAAPRQQFTLQKVHYFDALTAPNSRRRHGGVICNVTNIRVSERLASTVPYLLPLFDGLRYGRFFFQQFPISLLIVEPLAPLIKVYFSLPFASLIAFFALYYGVVQNSNFSRYVRYNTMQSILLDIGLILPSILEQVFKMPKGKAK